MKKIYLTTALGLTLALTAFAEPPKPSLSASSWYKRGMAAVKAGKPDEAKTAFRKALQVEPGFVPAKYQLSRIPELNTKTKLARRRALFQTTIIKEINFDNATLTEALNALNTFATKASKDKFSPNFVIQDAKSQVKEKPVTLKMKNVPLSAALSYILEGVGATARYDEHATVIRPRSK